MRKVREVLRLHYATGMSLRAVARSLKVSPAVPAKAGMGRCIRRAEAQGLGWPLPDSLDDAGLERRLFPAPAPRGKPRPVPRWSEVHRELRAKGVTLALLWEEYKAVHPEGLQYSWFCEQYRAWASKLDVVMRQEHRAGEKLFVDSAGHTVGVVDRRTGELRQAQVFVAVLGASSSTYAEATWTQGLADWVGSHVRAFEFFGGCPELVVPDNLRAAVSRAHPPAYAGADTNPTYHDLARHYGVAVLPARVRRPRDKAKVEVGVQVVERWILAALRHRTCFSLAELNAAIAELLQRLNARALRKLPGSRRSLFEQLDRPALRPLPTERYVFAEWKKVRVNIDSHVEVAGHDYSVPHALARRPLDVRLTAHTVECLYRGQRVASHVRSSLKGRHTTADEHMPERHRRMGQWTPERFIRWAEKTGPHTATLITTVLGSRRHPQQAFRPCLGILRLAKSYGEARLEAAARWPSAATATAASSPSPDSGTRGQASPIASTGLPPSRSNPPPRSCTTTSAAPTTTPERTPTC